MSRNTGTIAGIVLALALAGAGGGPAALAQEAAVESDEATPFASPAAADSLSILFILAALVVLWMLWKADVIRPGSFERLRATGGGREILGTPAWKWLAAAFTGFFAASLGAALAQAALHLAGLPVAGLRADGLTTLAATIVGGTIAWLAIHLAVGAAGSQSAPQRAIRAGLSAASRDLPIAAIAMLLAMPLIAATSALALTLWTLLTGEEPAAVAHSTLEDLLAAPGNPWSHAVILGVVVGAPVMEELIFRLGVQSALLRLTNSRWLAVLIASTLFATVHIGAVPPYGLPTLFACGLAFGLAFERTGRIGVPILMHAMFNAMNVAMAYGME